MKRELSDTEIARRQELLVQRATETLDARSEAELARLDPDAVGDEELELAAAAIALVSLRVEPMPASLATRIGAGVTPASTAPAVPAVAATLPDRVASPIRARRWSRVMAPLAAAAAVALAFGGGYLLAKQRAEAPPPAAMRDDSPVWRLALHGAGTDHAISGELRFSIQTQGGVLRVRGLAVNAPAVARYQLWILDRARDPRFPVDGGVFDVVSSGETSVPFKAKLRIAEPTSVLVTLEAPEGAVVSTRDRPVLTSD